MLDDLQFAHVPAVVLVVERNGAIGAHLLVLRQDVFSHLLEQGAALLRTHGVTRLVEPCGEDVSEKILLHGFAQRKLGAHGHAVLLDDGERFKLPLRRQGVADEDRIHADGGEMPRGEGKREVTVHFERRQAAAKRRAAAEMTRHESADGDARLVQHRRLAHERRLGKPRSFAWVEIVQRVDVVEVRILLQEIREELARDRRSVDLDAHVLGVAAQLSDAGSAVTVVDAQGMDAHELEG